MSDKFLVLSIAEDAATNTPIAQEGDVVTISWRCMDQDGNLLGHSDEEDDPTTFEVGTGDIVGNKLFEAFDEAVRGLSLGERVNIRVRSCELRSLPYRHMTLHCDCNAIFFDCPLNL